MTAPSNHATIHAHPSKDLVISILTRDIGLVDAVLDLVDNAIHSLIVLRKLDVISEFYGTTREKKLNATIKISTTRSEFSIVDTCGGIAIADARDEVFVFGKLAEAPGARGLGVYGVGMKRAVFKMGKKIVIESHTASEEFRVDIDVEKWRKDERNWDLRFTYERPRRGKGPAGTKIAVSDLNGDVGSHLTSESFLGHLLEKISRCYTLFLRDGLEVSVNNKKAKPSLPAFGRSTDLKVTRQRTTHRGVDILIMAGLSPLTDRRAHGWYVFCNGRMVVEADKSRLTGWGDSLPLWNPKYNHFLGIVMFGSKDATKLPWKTTKDSVELEHPVYQHALGQMRMLGNPIARFLTNLYTDEAPQSAEREVLGGARPVAMKEVARGKNEAFVARVPKASALETVSIQYRRRKSDVSRIAKAIDKPRLPAGKVGEWTFDFFLKNLRGD